MLTVADQLPIQMQTAGHLTSHLNAIYNIITLVELYFCLKSLGIVSSIAFLEGQMFICPSFKYMKLIQVINILLTVDIET